MNSTSSFVLPRFVYIPNILHMRDDTFFFYVSPMMIAGETARNSGLKFRYFLFCYCLMFVAGILFQPVDLHLLKRK